MISRRPKDSPIAVTYSNSNTWKDCDQDVLALWPTATGYSYLLVWPKTVEDMTHLAILFEVFGPDAPPSNSEELDIWVDRPGAVARAQSVFLMPDILDAKPDVLYRIIGAPDPNIVETCVGRHGKGVS